MSDEDPDEPGGAGKALDDMSDEEIAAAQAEENAEGAGGKAKDGAENVHPIGNGRRGRSVADRAAEPEEQPEEQPELFPDGVIDSDPSVTLKNLIKANHKVEMVVAMSRAEVPLRGGIPHPEKTHRMLVSTELTSVKPVAQREGARNERKLKGWKMVADLRVTYVEPATLETMLPQFLEELVAEDRTPAAVEEAVGKVLEWLEERSAAA